MNGAGDDTLSVMQSIDRQVPSYKRSSCNGPREKFIAVLCTITLPFLYESLTTNTAMASSRMHMQFTMLDVARGFIYTHLNNYILKHSHDLC
jgi:hypothetical protein